jgi:hypothetical protein
MPAGVPPGGEHPLSAAAAAMRKRFGHPSKGGAGNILGEIDKAAGGDTRVADAMKAIFSGESLHNKGYDLGDKVNGKPTSFGPFQAHFARDHKAIGDQMLAAGIDARDPKSIQAQAKWIADYLKANPHMNIGKVWSGYQRGLSQMAAGKGRFGGGGYEGAGDGRTAEQHQALIDAAKKANPFTLGAPAAESGYGQGTPSPLKVVGNAHMAGVDPKIVEAATAGASHLPKGYSVEIFSGKRGGTDPHGHGEAIDVQIRKPDGTLIPSRGADTTGMYQRLAQLTYGEIKARHPELANRYAWGGSFETSRGSGVPDLMHHDLMGRRGGIRPGMHPQIQALGSIPLAPPRPSELAKKEKAPHVPPDFHDIKGALSDINLGNIRAKGGGFQKFRDEYEAAHAIVDTMKKYPHRFGADTISKVMRQPPQADRRDRADRIAQDRAAQCVTSPAPSRVWHSNKRRHRYGEAHIVKNVSEGLIGLRNDRLVY